MAGGRFMIILTFPRQEAVVWVPKLYMMFYYLIIILKIIQNIIKGFIDYSYEVRHLSPATVRGHYMAIKHFYESNEITLNWSLIKDYVGMHYWQYETHFGYSLYLRENSQDVDNADERKRVVILLPYAATGIRRGAVCELKYGDFKWIEKHQIYEIKVYSGYRKRPVC